MSTRRKIRTLQFRFFNVDENIVQYAFRFPLCETYKAIYRTMKEKYEVIDSNVHVMYK